MWSRLRNSRSTIPLLVLFMGLSAAIATWSSQRTREEIDEASKFTLVAESLSEQLQVRIQADADVLRFVQSFAQLDPLRAATDFNRYLERSRGQGRSGLHAVALVRRLTPEALTAWQAARSTEPGLPPLRIHPLGDDPALHHDIIERVDPPLETEGLLGLDLATHARCAAAMDQAAVSGRASVSLPLTWTVAQDGRRVTAVIVALPVYRDQVVPEQVARRLTELHGFVVGLILGDRYLRGIFEPSSGAGSRKPNRELILSDDDGYDRADDDFRVGLFGGPALEGGRTSRSEFPVFDRLWALEVTESMPRSMTIDDLLARSSTTLPVAVFLVVALCAGIVWTLSRQNLRVQQEVKQRTHELNQKNVQLEASERELEAVNARLLEQSNTDALTGVANRRGFELQLEKERQRTTRTSVPYGLLIFDVDFFKGYNDRYGHVAGDEVLKRVADTLFAEARRIDCVARYGGEEFVVLASGTDATGLLAMGERIRARMQEAGIANEASPLGILTISGGGALSSVDPEHAPRPVFEVADGCLYEAKATGRNRVVMRM